MPFVSVAVCWTHTRTHIHFPPPPSLPLVTKHTVLNIHTNKRYCYARFLQGGRDLQMGNWNPLNNLWQKNAPATIIRNRMHLSRTVLFAQGCPLFDCEKFQKVLNLLWVLANDSTNTSVHNVLYCLSNHFDIWWCFEALMLWFKRVLSNKLNSCKWGGWPRTLL